VQGLESEVIAGAALDVYEHEEIVGKQLGELDAQLQPLKQELDALLVNPRVVMTAHNAFNTHEAIERILATTCENIIGFANGNPQNLVI
jgi:D-lactate dehydrogenase